ncbi:hypothetical protein AVEN_229408-1 [Araneus ventricosus]|uniref:Uncharacterized protein n=1 Tax=Araneus ventricosus TaxID=182803 RepID=A0A4Y2T5H1_ARAVE|nr:hypothetical protein AVEN_229408-1 [Araneus ventricosus]
MRGDETPLQGVYKSKDGHSQPLHFTPFHFSAQVGHSRSFHYTSFSPGRLFTIARLHTILFFGPGKSFTGRSAQTHNTMGQSDLLLHLPPRLQNENPHLLRFTLERESLPLRIYMGRISAFTAQQFKWSAWISRLVG